MIGEQIANAAHLGLMRAWREVQMEAWLKSDAGPKDVVREELLDIIQQALDAIEIYPGKGHPMTASEVLFRTALYKYRNNNETS